MPLRPVLSLLLLLRYHNTAYLPSSPPPHLCTTVCHQFCDMVHDVIAMCNSQWACGYVGRAGTAVAVCCVCRWVASQFTPGQDCGSYMPDSTVVLSWGGLNITCDILNREGGEHDVVVLYRGHDACPLACYPRTPDCSVVLPLLRTAAKTHYPSCSLFPFGCWYASHTLPDLLRRTTPVTVTLDSSPTTVPLPADADTQLPTGTLLRWFAAHPFCVVVRHGSTTLPGGFAHTHLPNYAPLPTPPFSTFDAPGALQFTQHRCPMVVQPNPLPRFNVRRRFYHAASRRVPACPLVTHVTILQRHIRTLTAAYACIYLVDIPPAIPTIHNLIPYLFCRVPPTFAI